MEANDVARMGREVDVTTNITALDAPFAVVPNALAFISSALTFD